MFEKEAEEYADEYGKDAFTQFNMPQWIKPIRMERKLGFQKGAEFGFQKGIKAKINTTTISDCPIKDEWHYVKDGDLPKTGNPCLVYLVNDCAIVARLREDNVWTIDGHNAFENVVAWKEIVPPKETE